MDCSSMAVGNLQSANPPRREAVHWALAVAQLAAGSSFCAHMRPVLVSLMTLSPQSVRTLKSVVRLPIAGGVQHCHAWLPLGQPAAAG